MSIARALFENWQKAVDRTKPHRLILVRSTSCEPWGFDSLRYTFKDKSHLVWCKITKTWDI